MNRLKNINTRLKSSHTRPGASEEESTRRRHAYENLFFLENHRSRPSWARP